jgi:hypothetical protein
MAPAASHIDLPKRIKDAIHMDNYQALAYATLALKELGCSRADIGAARGKMLHMFDLKSPSAAEQEAAAYLANIPFTCGSCNKELQVSPDRYERDYGGQTDCMTCREWRR